MSPTLSACILSPHLFVCVAFVHPCVWLTPHCLAAQKSKETLAKLKALEARAQIRTDHKNRLKATRESHLETLAHARHLHKLSRGEFDPSIYIHPAPKHPAPAAHLPPPPTLATTPSTPKSAPATQYELMQRRISSLYSISKARLADDDPQAMPVSTPTSTPSSRRNSTSNPTPLTCTSTLALHRLSILAIDPDHASQHESLDSESVATAPHAHASSSATTTTTNNTPPPRLLRSFEHCLMIGLTEPEIMTAVESGDLTTPQVPGILSSFPPDKPLALEALGDFAFPDGITIAKLPPPSRRRSTEKQDTSTVRGGDEAILLFDTTASDFDNDDLSSDSSDDEDDEYAPRIKTSTLYGILLRYTYTKTITRPGTTWGKNELVVSVPRAMMLLSRNAFAPLHFGVMRFACRVWGAEREDAFGGQTGERSPADMITFPPKESKAMNPKAMNPKVFDSNTSKTSSSWFGFSNVMRMNSQNGNDFDARFDDPQQQLPDAPPFFSNDLSDESSRSNNNPFDAVDFNDIPNFEAGRRRSSAVSTHPQQARGSLARSSLAHVDSSLFQFLQRYQNLHIPHPNRVLLPSQSPTVTFNLYPHNPNQGTGVASDPASVISFNPRLSLPPPAASLHACGSSCSSSHPLDNNPYIIAWSLPTLLKSLSLSNILLALGCALTEMQVRRAKRSEATPSCVCVGRLAWRSASASILVSRSEAKRAMCVARLARRSSSTRILIARRCLKRSRALNSLLKPRAVRDQFKPRCLPAFARYTVPCHPLSYPPSLPSLPFPQRRCPLFTPPPPLFAHMCGLFNTRLARAGRLQMRRRIRSVVLHRGHSSPPPPPQMGVPHHRHAPDSLACVFGEPGSGLSGNY